MIYFIVEINIVILYTSREIDYQREKLGSNVSSVSLQ
jgi:hypothetical protein